MKRSTTLAFSIAVASLAASTAFAQDNFPDTPANHWAFEALAKLKKDGLLVGYPDDLFRGGRPASRYELAVAIQAAYSNLKGAFDSVDAKVKALGENKTASVDDVKALKDAVSALTNDVNQLKSYGDDIANLKKAAATFEKELASLGVNVEALKKDLNDLNTRVAALEKKKPSISITGTADFWIGAGNSNDNFFGLTKDGRFVGTTNNTLPLTATSTPDGKAGLTRDLTILHEAAFDFAGTNEKGPKWKATLVSGNMIGSSGQIGFGNQSNVVSATVDGNYSPIDSSTTTSGNFGYSEPISSFYFNELSVSVDGHDYGKKFSVEAGRIGVKVSPYFFQRLDNTTYFQNGRWDNGKYLVDGANFSFDLGAGKLGIFGGRTSSQKTSAGTQIQQLATGQINGWVAQGTGGYALPIDRVLGGTLSQPLGTGSVKASYIVLDSDKELLSGDPINRLVLFGGEGEYSYKSLNLSGGYHIAKLQNGDSTFSDTANEAWNVNLHYHGSKVGAYGEFKSIGANYVAPGDWGRLGVLRNPTNVFGWKFGSHYQINSKLRLQAGAEFLTGKEDFYAPNTGLGYGTKANTYTAKLTYASSSSLSFHVGYEDTALYNLYALTGFSGTGDPHYKWINFGFTSNLSAQSKLMVQYEVSSVDNDYQVSDGTVQLKGGFLTTQLSLKF